MYLVLAQKPVFSLWLLMLRNGCGRLQPLANMVHDITVYFTCQMENSIKATRMKVSDLALKFLPNLKLSKFNCLIQRTNNLSNIPALTK